MTTEDERGRLWVVEAGDPAREWVNRLVAKGVRMVVLPAWTYRTGGAVSGWMPAAVEPLKELRMRDCVAFLTQRNET